MRMFGFFSQSSVEVVVPSSLVMETSDCLRQCARMFFLESLTVDQQMVLKNALELNPVLALDFPVRAPTNYLLQSQKDIQIQALRFLRMVFQENEMPMLAACLDNQTKQKILDALKFIAMDIACREKINVLGYHPIGEEASSSWIPSVW